MPTWLGIDIGRAAVKVALVRSAYRKTTLEAVTTVDIDDEKGVEPAIREAVASALGGAVTASDGISIALDGSRAALRTLQVPASAQKQLAEVLPFELEAQLPFEISDSVFDFRTLAAPKHLAGAEPSAGPGAAPPAARGASRAAAGPCPPGPGRRARLDT